MIWCMLWRKCNVYEKKTYLQLIGKMSEWMWQAVAEVCASTVEQGGVAGTEFSADVTFSQWFCSLINVCSSLQSLLCLFERNIALQPKIQGNLGDLYEQNDVSVSKVQFRFKVFIPRIPSVFRYRGKSLALNLFEISQSEDERPNACVPWTGRI